MSVPIRDRWPDFGHHVIIKIKAQHVHQIKTVADFPKELQHTLANRKSASQQQRDGNARTTKTVKGRNMERTLRDYMPDNPVEHVTSRGDQQRSACEQP